MRPLQEPLATTWPGESARALTLSSTPAGTTMGRNDSEWGQMGVIMMAGTLGWIMEAPAATAYAVLPVGVETITPGNSRRSRSLPTTSTAPGAHDSPARTVALHRGDEVPVQVDVHVGQVGGGASVNHHFVQDLGPRPRTEAEQRPGSVPKAGAAPGPSGRP